MSTGVCIYILCMVTMAILLFGMGLQKPSKDKPSTTFTYLLLSVTAFLIISFASELVEGLPKLKILSYLINWLNYIMADVVLIAFIAYLHMLIKSNSGKNTKWLNVPVGICLARIVMITVMTICGQLFIIDDNGTYIERPLNWLPYVVSFAAMAFAVAITIVNRPCFTKRQFTVIIIYQSLPIVPIIIESYTDLYSITGATFTMAALMIYVLIQAVAIEDGQIRESMLIELSSKDLLTDLNNRRAYYDRISRLKSDQCIGVVFCDINGLKYTNDHFGHAAGDTLIKTFAKKLRDFFPVDCVFRISGDEFVVLIPGGESDLFERNAYDFRSTLQNGDPIAAVGYSFGTGACIDRLIADAEAMMYTDKERCHNTRQTNNG